MSGRPVIWSYGGGTQSVAIAVLVHQGRLPMPERIVMADTGREASETWEYLEYVVRPRLGLNVEVAPHSLSTTDLYSLASRKVLLPMFTAGGGKLHTFCSSEWKRDVVRRWLRSRGYGPKNPALAWLGISVDEVHRAKPSGVKWLTNHWPLLFDIPMRRDECRALVRTLGLPDPPRSSCWMCPHRGNEQWKRLRDHYPKDWEAALGLEAEIREKDPLAFLHAQRVPLSEADLNDDQGDLFGNECEGICGV